MNRWIKKLAILAVVTTGVTIAATKDDQTPAANPRMTGAANVSTDQTPIADRPFTGAPGTSPSSPLSLKAQQDLDNQQYALALPEFQKLAQQSKDLPDELAIINEKIRVCQRNIASATTQPTADIPITADKRIPHPTPQPGETMEMAIKELGNFDYDADHGGNIPADVKALSGHEIKLHGFMIPMDQAASITQFALVPSLFACCFGQPPQLQHTVVVTCPKGKAINYFPDEISVDGMLTVDEKKDDGFIVSVFQVEAKSVKPLAK